MRVRAYRDADAQSWDDFCAGAPMATFLHTRRFLSYHGDRFKDMSLIIEDDSGRWLGVLPAALAESEKIVVSHPGSTFGGLIHQGRLMGETMIEALGATCRHFAESGLAVFRYKAVPRIYHRRPADDDIYALFRIGAERTRCDLSCAIDLSERGPIADRRRRGQRKAARAGIRISDEARAMEQFWKVLSDTLAERHGARPVHQLAEIELLRQRFPETIRLVTANLEDEVIAGTLLFSTRCAVHAQYIAASQAGRDAGALDAIFEHSIAWATSRGCRYFDFGISNEDNGRYLNTGLYDFKSEFGASGVIHEFYDIDLTRSLPCP